MIKLLPIYAAKTWRNSQADKAAIGGGWFKNATAETKPFARAPFRQCEERR
jgi:hypothetical protein